MSQYLKLLPYFGTLSSATPSKWGAKSVFVSPPLETDSASFIYTCKSGGNKIPLAIPVPLALACLFLLLNICYFKGGCGQGTSVTLNHIVGSISSITFSPNEILLSLTPSRHYRYNYSHYWSSGKGAEYSRREKAVKDEKFTLKIEAKRKQSRAILKGKTELAWPNDLDFEFLPSSKHSLHETSIMQYCKQTQLLLLDEYQPRIAKYSDASQDRLALEQPFC